MFLEFEKESIQKALDDHGIKHEVTLAYICSNGLYCIVCKNAGNVDELTRDVVRAIDREEHEYFIVGSDALDHFLGTKHSKDVDVWVENYEIISSITDYLVRREEWDYTTDGDEVSAPDNKYTRRRTAQFVVGKLFDFANFDLTVCKIGMRLDDDEIRFYFTPKSFADILARRCGYHKIFEPHFRNYDPVKRVRIDFEQVFKRVSGIIEVKIDKDLFKHRFMIQRQRIEKYSERGFDMYPSDDIDLLTTLVDNNCYLG